MYVDVAHTCSTCLGQKMEPDLLELELWIVMNCPRSAGNSKLVCVRACINTKPSLQLHH